jgi:hypothetical protein
MRPSQQTWPSKRTSLTLTDLCLSALLTWCLCHATFVKYASCLLDLDQVFLHIPMRTLVFAATTTITQPVLVPDAANHGSIIAYILGLQQLKTELTVSADLFSAQH